MKNQKALPICLLALALIIMLSGFFYVYFQNKNNQQREDLFNNSLIQIIEKEKAQTVAAQEVISGKTQDMTKPFYAPILMYHHLAKKVPQDSYYVSPEIFDQQIAWLKDNKYSVISYDKYYDYVQSGVGMPEKPVVITFDDGDLDHYTNAFPILKKYGYTATFFIKLNNIGENKGGMTWSMIKEMSQAGMTIGSHSVNHDDMAKMTTEQIDFELTESKKVLEENLKTSVKFFAYPGGAFSPLTIKETQKAGYLSAVTTRHKVWHDKKDNIFQVPRIHIDDEMPSFINWIQGVGL